MSVVLEFYQVTVKLIQQLEKSKGEREENITTLEVALSQRELLMKKMVPPYTSKEVEIGQKLTQLNSKLEKLLEIEKNSIQKDIKELQNRKESNTKYADPYSSISTDGMFYDKRK